MLLFPRLISSFSPQIFLSFPLYPTSSQVGFKGSRLSHTTYPPSRSPLLSITHSFHPNVLFLVYPHPASSYPPSLASRPHPLSLTSDSYRFILPARQRAILAYFHFGNIRARRYRHYFKGGWHSSVLVLYLCRRLFRRCHSHLAPLCIYTTYIQEGALYGDGYGGGVVVIIIVIMVVIFHFKVSDAFIDLFIDQNLILFFCDYY